MPTQSPDARRLTEQIRRFAHDMRTPLGSLISTVEMLSSGGYDPLTPKQARAVERAARVSQRTLTMLEDFVIYVKAQSADLSLHPTPFHPVVLLERALDKVRATAASKGLSLTLEGAGTPLTLTGDTMLIPRVIEPLLWNAVAFTERGGVTVRSAWDGRVWEVGVEDTGIGISAEQQPHIFEAFWRGDARPQVPTAGAGLGLAVAQALTVLMLGTLTLERSDETGSTFLVRLPLT